MTRKKAILIKNLIFIENMTAHGGREQASAHQQQHLLQDSQLAETQQTSKMHPLTLFQIAPRWASVLASTPKTDKLRFRSRGKLLDISQMKKCIVGEAHEFRTDKYDDCSTCYKTSLDFASLLREVPSRRKAPLAKFVAHWNSKHV
jgi:hypothetical protein